MPLLSKVIEDHHMRKILLEFSRLGDRSYLDNAGTALYPDSLLQSINEDLKRNIYMNPHTDKYTRDCIENIRSLVLRHFNTDPTNYTVIFTSGTTQSLKLVAESFQFASYDYEVSNCGSFVHLQDNHTSVLGLREIATEKNADVYHISHDDFLKSLINPLLPLITPNDACKNEGNTLLVYPAQSNFNGYKYPIDFMDSMKKGCLNSYLKKKLHNWYVMLDAASFVSTSRLDLSQSQPDFVCLSFYKIFGYPTGLGAVLVKNSSADILSQKKYYGGGTVDALLSSEPFHIRKENLYERFEDGTYPFLAITALQHCFETIHRIIPKAISNDPMDTVAHHTFRLGQDLYKQLLKLRHTNGAKAAILYMDTDYTDVKRQGGIVTFNLLREDETYIGYTEFLHYAEIFKISVRTGCFCNSGSCQRHLKFTSKEMKDRYYEAGYRCGDEMDIIEGKPTGCIRVSFGYYNTHEDVNKVIKMIIECFINIKQNKQNQQTYNYIEKSINREYNNEKSKLSNDKLLRSVEILPRLSHHSKIILKEIVIYPIKSCGPFKIKSGWKIGPKGFDLDKEWMVINSNETCMTQQLNKKMCMIHPKIDLNQNVMTLHFNGKPPISVPIQPKTLNKVKVFSVDSTFVHGYDYGDEVASWISEALNIPHLRLIRQLDCNTNSQVVNGDRGGHLLPINNEPRFLMINKATVRRFSNKIRCPTFQSDVDELTDRFRGNMIIEMDQQLAESGWQHLVIGKHEFQVVDQCLLGQTVNVNQKNSEKNVEFTEKSSFGWYLNYVGTKDGADEQLFIPYTPVKPIIKNDDFNN